MICFRLGSRQMIMLMSFEEGTPLPEVDSDLARHLFESNKSEALRILGNVLALDILINNWDRLPLQTVRDNRGNSSNLLLSREGTENVRVALLDQTVTSFTTKTAQGKYLARVKVTVETLNSGDADV